MASTCQGCGKGATEFQCPLCQAEAQPAQGFFCSQSCFAEHWLDHRNTFHKSGVVREKKRQPGADAANSSVKAKKPRGEKAADAAAAVDAAEEKSARSMVYLPWPPMPSGRSSFCDPALTPDVRRAVVGIPAGASKTDAVAAADVAFWPALVSAAHLARAFVSAHKPSSAAAPAARVLVVAGSARTAHAFSWAARCAGLTGALRLAVNVAQTAESCAPRGETGESAGAGPSTLFSIQRPVIVATAAVVRSVGGADVNCSGAAGLWLSSPGADEASLLITLPDVEDAGDLQSVSTPAVFYVARTARADRPADLLATARWSAEEKITHVVHSGPSLAAALPHGTAFAEMGLPLVWQAMPTTSSAETEGETSAAAATALSRHHCVSDKLDNELSTSLGNGDTGAAIQHLVRIYSSDPGYFEEVFYSSVCCDWGAISVAHAHHRLAYVMRLLVDSAEQFSTSKGASIADATLRAATRLVRLLPPMGVAASATESHSDSASAASAKERRDYYNHYYTAALPNLQLQATLCHLFGVASPGAIDILAAAWGVQWCLEGWPALSALNKTRQPMVERVMSRYGAKFGKPYGTFLVILAQLLYDTVAVYSLPEAEVERRLLWNVTLAHDLGPLPTFLANALLLPASTATKSPAKGKRALSSRQATPVSAARERLEKLREHAVRAASAADYVALPWRSIPLTGQREREVERLHRAAVEEVLMAMPREPRPMYVGDVGNLIGKWFRFNARFDGVLGVTLSDFLHKHPEDFTLAGTLVTRRRAGKTEQVRIRFDHDDGSDADSDGDGSGRRKAHDRALLTGSSASRKGKKGSEKDLPARARKKRAVKEFNRQRHNRNYKAIDPSARVPGYIKRGPRRITGRGKKPNKRLVKRG